MYLLNYNIFYNTPIVLDSISVALPADGTGILLPQWTQLPWCTGRRALPLVAFDF